MRLKLESETIGRTGGITGSGAKKVIGAPHIDSLEVVLREAIQNSWDAAEEDQIQFGVSAFELKGAAKRALADALHEGTHRRDALFTVPDGPVEALLLWDKGTSGLGGGLRPDEDDDSRRDFVRFVYMIGDTKAQTDNLAKGGTYGFGRSSFLNASRMGTILVHTACEFRGKRQCRFIGMSWTDPDRLTRTRLTGRHWWGQADGQHATALTGHEANAIAKSLGMDVFQPGERGTAILILEPRWAIDEDNLSARAKGLAQVQAGVLWNCWPRLIDRSIKVSVSWFGSEVTMPDPRDDARLKVFTRALEISQRASAPPGSLNRSVECMRPAKTLGSLAVTKVGFLAGPKPEAEEADDSRQERDPSTPLRHIAMMRGTKLVIHYLEGPTPPDGLQYAGIFLADPGVDNVYAMSEPPAHDEWVKERLTGQGRTIVNVTYRRIQEHIRDFLRPPASITAEGIASDFGRIADQLGELFVNVEGDGSGRVHPRGNGGGEGGGQRSKIQVRLLEPEIAMISQDDLELRVPVVLETRGNLPAQTTLAVRALVGIDGGVEKQKPLKARVPRVLGWEVGPGASLVQSHLLNIQVKGKREVFVRISQPRDCAVRIAVEAT